VSVFIWYLSFILFTPNHEREIQNKSDDERRLYWSKGTIYKRLFHPIFFHFFFLLCYYQLRKKKKFLSDIVSDRSPHVSWLDFFSFWNERWRSASVALYNVQSLDSLSLYSSIFFSTFDTTTLEMGNNFLFHLFNRTYVTQTVKCSVWLSLHWPAHPLYNWRVNDFNGRHGGIYFVSLVYVFFFNFCFKSIIYRRSL
jgi:hypothetical protein